LCAALVALGVTGFVLLTRQVSRDGRLVGRDWSVLGWFQRTAAAHPGFDGTAQVLSDVGNVQVSGPVLLAGLVFAVWRGRRDGRPRWWLPPLAGVLVIVVVPVVVSKVKSAVARPAPGKIHLGPHTYAGFFPSGHTATSSVAVGTAVLLVLPWVRRPVARWLLAAVTVLLLLAVGAGLVWHGYHWPLDVLASWCLAVALLALVAAANACARPARPPAPADGPSASPPAVAPPSAVGGESEVEPPV
jgi:undecaprenyl-diphosphatase